MTINSPAFKRWFSHSRVVDENGQPLVVYHGTSRKFTEFDLSFAGSNNDPGMWGKGFYFSDRMTMGKAYGSTLIPVFLSLQNPFIVRQVSRLPREMRPVHDAAGASRLRQKLIDQGYDGVIHYEVGDTPNKLGQLVAFYPGQIKSAVANRGTFDPANPNIYDSLPEPQYQKRQAPVMTEEGLTP